VHHRHTGSETYTLISLQACAPEIVIAACTGDAEHIAWAAQGGEILDLYAEGHYLNMNRFDSADSTQTCFPPDNWATHMKRRDVLASLGVPLRVQDCCQPPFCTDCQQ